MSKNIELQEEFEALIGELERLKSINQITSENSINAKKTINKIESFVKSVDVFKTSIEKDYQLKKNELNGFEDSIKETIDTLNENAEKQTKRFEDLVENFTNKSNQTLESVKEKLEKKVDAYTSEIKNLRSKIENDITEFNIELTEKIEQNSVQFKETLIENKESLDKEIITLKNITNDNQNEILSHFQSINSEIEINRNRLRYLTVFIIAVVIVAVISIGSLIYYFI